MKIDIGHLAEVLTAEPRVFAPLTHWQHIIGAVLVLSMPFCLTLPAYSSDDTIYVALTYDNQSSKTMSTSAYVTNIHCGLPPGKWILPELKDNKPFFYWIRLGDQERLLVLDCIPSTNSPAGRYSRIEVSKMLANPDGSIHPWGWFFNRAYIDSRGNGNLRDGLVLDGAVTVYDLFPPRFDAGVLGNVVFSTTFTAAEIMVHVGTNVIPYRFQLVVEGNALNFPVVGETSYMRTISAMQIRSIGCYRGSLSFNGKRHEVFVTDTKANGCLDAVCIPDAGVKERVSEASRRVTTLVLGGKTYHPSIDVAGPRLVLTSDAASICPVTLTSRPERMELIQTMVRHGKEDAMVLLLDPESEIRLPADAYYLSWYRLAREDVNGHRWLLTVGDTFFDTGERSNATWQVVAGRKNEIRFGEPFNARAVIGSENTAEVDLNLVVTDCATKSLLEVEVGSRNRQRTPDGCPEYKTVSPSYRIVNAREETIGQGVFGRGCLGFSAIWSDTNAVRGEDCYLTGGYTNTPFVMKEERAVLKKRGYRGRDTGTALNGAKLR